MSKQEYSISYQSEAFNFTGENWSSFSLFPFLLPPTPSLFMQYSICTWLVLYYCWTKLYIADSPDKFPIRYSLKLNRRNLLFDIFFWSFIWFFIIVYLAEIELQEQIPVIIQNTRFYKNFICIFTWNNVRKFCKKNRKNEEEEREREFSFNIVLNKNFDSMDVWIQLCLAVYQQFSSSETLHLHVRYHTSVTCTYAHISVCRY